MIYCVLLPFKVRLSKRKISISQDHLDNIILYKSHAGIALLECLGGLWFIMAKMIKFIPKVI
jgi:hypothetical protein